MSVTFGPRAVSAHARSMPKPSLGSICVLCRTPSTHTRRLLRAMVAFRERSTIEVANSSSSLSTSSPASSYDSRKGSSDEKAASDSSAESVATATAERAVMMEDEGGNENRALPSNELLRRQKISKANKGRVPWNKGRQLSEEVKSLIAQRTKEAMARPDVRAKLRRGNRNRPPHREEVKERIRANLKARSDRIKNILQHQAVLVTAAMEESDSEEEREAAAFKKADETFVKLAWRVIRADHHRAFEQWRDNENGLRDLFTARLMLLKEKQALTAEKARATRLARSSRTRSSKSKIRLALSTQKQLLLAQKKLKDAEIKVEKMQSLKAALANDEAKLKVLIAAESQAKEVLAKLRQHVSELNETMAPLQEYLDPKDPALDAMKAAAAARANFPGANSKENVHLEGQIAKPSNALENDGGRADGVEGGESGKTLNGHADAVSTLNGHGDAKAEMNLDVAL